MMKVLILNRIKCNAHRARLRHPGILKTSSLNSIISVICYHI